MKMNIIFFMSVTVFVSILLIFNSCDKTDQDANSYSFTYMLKNQSGKDIELGLYNPDNTLFKKYVVAMDSTVLLDKGVSNPVTGTDLHLINSLDSAVFTFNDGRILVQTFYNRGVSDTVNNVLSVKSYQTVSSVKNSHKLLFILTEEDYNRSK